MKNSLKKTFVGCFQVIRADDVEEKDIGQAVVTLNEIFLEVVYKFKPFMITIFFYVCLYKYDGICDIQL